MAEYECDCPPREVETHSFEHELANQKNEVPIHLFLKRPDTHMIRPRTIYEIYNEQFDIVEVLNADGSIVSSVLDVHHLFMDNPVVGYSHESSDHNDPLWFFNLKLFACIYIILYLFILRLKFH